MYITAEYCVHFPMLEICALNSGECVVIFNPQQDATSLKIGQSDNLLRQLLGAQIVAFELHA